MKTLLAVFVALYCAETIHAEESGQEVADRIVDTILDFTPRSGLEPNRSESADLAFLIELKKEENEDLRLLYALTIAEKENLRRQRLEEERKESPTPDFRPMFFTKESDVLILRDAVKRMKNLESGGVVRDEPVLSRD